MNRLHKKCFIASTGVHLLLALVLLVGPAFLAPSSKPENLPLLNFVPIETVDALASGGGNPKAQPPPALPPPAPPQPKADKAPLPEPPKEPAKEVAPPNFEEPAEPSPLSKRRLPDVSTEPVTRTPNTRDEAKNRAEAQAKEEAKALSEAQKRLARELNRAADRIGGQVSGSTSIELPGPGGGGVPYANFLQAVKTVYANAWVVPEGVTDNQATAIASVTIARNGRVVKARITDRSGNAAVDQSVQATLDRVEFAAPLPRGAKEDERTVTINFNVRAKLGLG